MYSAFIERTREEICAYTQRKGVTSMCDTFNFYNMRDTAKFRILYIVWTLAFALPWISFGWATVGNIELLLGAFWILMGPTYEGWRSLGIAVLLFSAFWIF
jgi:hypothetical protein